MTASLVEHDANGGRRLAAISSETPLRPGQIVEYKLVASNSGTSAAHDIRPVVRIPAGTAYRAASAAASGTHAVAEYSIDGGRTWSPHPTETVRTPAGTAALRDAAPERYTNIRWSEPDSLSPAARESFSYEVIVK